MLPTLIKYVGRTTLTGNPPLWSSCLKLMASRSDLEATHIYNRILNNHRDSFHKADWTGFNNLKDTFSDLLLTSYLREPITDEVKNTLAQFPIQIFTINNQDLHIHPVWIDTLQQELSIDIFPQEIFQLKKPSYDTRYYGERIHYLHRATYAALKLRNKKFTLRNIYRDAIASDELVNIKSNLTKRLMLERDEAEIDGFKSLRVCSIKPHACENYDFEVRKRVRVILGRGMDDLGHQVVCTLPTVLFTIHEKAQDRYQGNIDSFSLNIINRKGMDKFFYLFQPEFI